MVMRFRKGLFGTAATEVVEDMVEESEAMVDRKKIRSSSLEEDSDTIKRKDILQGEVYKIVIQSFYRVQHM